MRLVFNTDLKSVICPWVYLLLEYKNAGEQDTNCVKASKSTVTFFHMISGTGLMIRLRSGLASALNRISTGQG